MSTKGNKGPTLMAGHKQMAKYTDRFFVYEFDTVLVSVQLPW